MVTKPAAAIPLSQPDAAGCDDPNTYYPDTDGEPLGETDYQFSAITDTVHSLRVRYENRADVYVAGDIFVYYREGNNSARVAPDVLVVFGVPKRMRRSYFIWEEGGKAPDFIIEVASQSTYHRDIGIKRTLYALLGVTEYWRFDPLGDCFAALLEGERLVNGRWQPIAVRRDAAGILRGYSELLGLDLCVRDGALRLYDPLAGVWLLTPSEENAARQAAETALHNAETARQAAEARNAALEALLRQHGISPDAV